MQISAMTTDWVSHECPSHYDHIGKIELHFHVQSLAFPLHLRMITVSVFVNDSQSQGRKRGSSSSDERIQWQTVIGSTYSVSVLNELAWK